MYRRPRRFQFRRKMKVVFHFRYTISNYRSVIKSITCLFTFIDGRYVTVGLYRINTGEITWDDYEPITWKGELKLCHVRT